MKLSAHGAVIRTITISCALELDKSGSGYLSLVSVVRDAPVDVYRVKKWTLSEWNITIELQPLTGEAEPFQFQQITLVYTPKMECAFSGKGWERKATLFSERDLDGLGERAQKAITKEKKKSR